MIKLATNKPTHQPMIRSKAINGTINIPKAKILIAYKIQANKTEKAMVMTILIMLKITRPEIHSLTVSGELKMLVKFLFQISSNKFVVISYCPRHTTCQKIKPDNIKRTILEIETSARSTY